MQEEINFFINQFTFKYILPPFVCHKINAGNLLDPCYIRGNSGINRVVETNSAYW